MKVKKLLVNINGRPMGELSLSPDGQYRFTYDRDYVQGGGRLFRELEIPSQRLFAVFSNALPEGKRLDCIKAFLKSNEPLDILSGVIDGQNGFSFQSTGTPHAEKVTYACIPETAKRDAVKDFTLQSPVSVPGCYFRNNARRMALDVKTAFSGVQDKFVAVLDENGLRIPREHERGNVLVKPYSNDFPLMPQNEMAFMTLHEEIFPGATPFACLVRDPERQGIFHFAVERFDVGKDTWFEAAQLMGVSEENKYDSMMEDLFHFMRSALSGDEFQKFVDRCVFCYLSGNSDMHLKNFSLSGEEDGKARLSPAYDMLCSKMYGDGDRLALPLQGDRRPRVGAFVEWLLRWGGDLRKRTEHIAKHLLLGLDPILGSMPGFTDARNKRWKDRIVSNVVPVCERTIAYCEDGNNAF